MSIVTPNAVNTPDIRMSVPTEAQLADRARIYAMPLDELDPGGGDRVAHRQPDLDEGPLDETHLCRVAEPEHLGICRIGSGLAQHPTDVGDPAEVDQPDSFQGDLAGSGEGADGCDITRPLKEYDGPGVLRHGASQPRPEVCRAPHLRPAPARARPKHRRPFVGSMKYRRACGRSTIFWAAGTGTGIPARGELSI